MPTMAQIEQDLYANKKELDLRPGDTVRVHVRITEGDKSRIQIFEGTVIAQKRGGPRTTITVRKVSNGVGVERIFPLHSPWTEKVEVIQRHKVRRAKLYFLRDRMGKKARLKPLRGWRPPEVADAGDRKESRSKRRRKARRAKARGGSES
jgi:large subunit ribosomal protein L19